MSNEAQQISRWRAAFAEPDAAPDPASCPTPETLWSAVRGELPPERMREVVDHVAACASCAEDWRLAAELRRDEEKAATVPGKVIQGRFGQWRPLAAAAALAAGLLIAVGVYRTNQPLPEPTYREVQHAGIRSLLPEGQALPRQAAVLRWSPLAGAVSYDLEVSTEDLRPVATAKGQAATEYRIPESALKGLPSGARLLWQVDAVRPDGTHENSGTFITPVR
ncbi:MAG: zf-HC2 domain-containing protein [Thermoanaerobaculia bacterium]